MSRSSPASSQPGPAVSGPGSPREELEQGVEGAPSFSQGESYDDSKSWRLLVLLLTLTIINMTVYYLSGFERRGGLPWGGGGVSPIPQVHSCVGSYQVRVTTGCDFIAKDSLVILFAFSRPRSWLQLELEHVFQNPHSPYAIPRGRTRGWGAEALGLG